VFSSSDRRTAASLQTTCRLNAPFSARTRTISRQLSMRFGEVASVHRDRQEPDVGVSIEISRLRTWEPEAEPHFEIEFSGFRRSTFACAAR